MRQLILLFVLLLGGGTLSAQAGCDQSTQVFLGVTSVDAYPFFNTNATDCFSGTPGDSAAWFFYVSPNDTTLRITSGFPGSTSVDSRLSVFSGSCGDLTCLDGDDDTGQGFHALVEIDVLAGEPVFIVFDDRYTNADFEFIIEEILPAVNLVDFTTLELPRNGSLRGAVDLNGDYLDDVISIRTDAVHAMFQNPDGTYTETLIETEAADHSPSWSMTAGDLNGDGANDLIYGGTNGATFMFSNGSGGFMEESPNFYIFCQRGNCVDINNDGLLDMFMCHDVQPNVFFINEGNTEFPPTQGGLGDTPDGGNYGSIWVDYDNDGDQDLFIAKCRGGDSDANINQLLRNDGDGVFTEIGEDVNLADRIQTWSSAWGDFDNDGDMDVFVGASSLDSGEYHRLMRNDDGIFTDVSVASGVTDVATTSIENCTHDFNNDGFLDIFGAGNTLFINNGDLTFTKAEVDAQNDGPVGDLNNDGFLDIVHERFGQTIIHFVEPNGNNWLKINTVGTVSNTNGIGARVELYTADNVQIRDVRSGDGFRHMSSLNTHFGIGTQTEIEKLVIKWPSGIQDEVVNPTINSTLTVVEGSSPSAVREIAPELLVLYPNPTTNFLQLPNELDLEDGLVDIFDSNGRLLLRQSTVTPRLDVAQLAAGSYLLVYRQAATIRLGRFVKR